MVAWFCSCNHWSLYYVREQFGVALGMILLTIIHLLPSSQCMHKIFKTCKQSFVKWLLQWINGLRPLYSFNSYICPNVIIRPFIIKTCIRIMIKMFLLFKSTCSWFQFVLIVWYTFYAFLRFNISLSFLDAFLIIVATLSSTLPLSALYCFAFPLIRIQFWLSSLHLKL